MAEEENITFMDLACILKIGSDTTWEKFGTLINSSIFDGANISGTLKQKGLIDFTQYYPGPTSIAVSEKGKQLKAEAESKGAMPLDALDDSILTQLFGGKRAPLELQNTLNIRPKDLALRLYKLSKQNFINYELRNGNIELMLTEQGFLKAKTPASQTVSPQAVAPQGAAANAMSGALPEKQAGTTMPATPQPSPAMPQAAGQVAAGMPGPIDPLTIVKAAKAKRKMTRVVEIAVVVVVVILAVLLALRYAGIITIT